jgi:hypothetical protein
VQRALLQDRQMPQAELRQAAMMRAQRIRFHALSSVAFINYYGAQFLGMSNNRAEADAHACCLALFPRWLIGTQDSKGRITIKVQLLRTMH